MNKCGLCEETIHYSSSHCKDCWGYVKRELRIAEWYAGIDSGGNSRRLSPAIRTHLLEQVNYKCEECGFDKNHPIDNSSVLEVDHIDGNGENHSPTNLKVLCPNCHALTPTYRARNKGKGRKVSYLRVMKNDEGVNCLSPATVKVALPPSLCQCGEIKQPKSKVCVNCFYSRGKVSVRKSRLENMCSCGKSIHKETKQCVECLVRPTKVDWPSTQELLDRVKATSYTQVGKELGVSDNAVRKRIKNHPIV